MKSLFRHPVCASVLYLTKEVVTQFEQKGIGLELSYFAIPEHLERDDFQDKVEETKELLKDFSYPVSIHGAFYDLSLTARDPMIVNVAEYRIRESLDIARELGMTQVVFHANYFPSKRKGFKELWLEKQIAFWQKILPQAEEFGITMMIENTREPDASYIGDLLTALDSPYAKTCLDTGHTHCFTDSRIPLREWVKVYGKHLAYVHLHNNYGVRDEHLAFTTGTLDFDDFFESLERLDNYPTMIMELKTREEFLKSYEAIFDVLGA